MTSTLRFYGGTNAVTGANFMLQSGAVRLLVDCGMIQGVDFAGQRNAEPFPYDPQTVTHLLVTHAHIDHIGRIPKLVRDGFRGEIVSTPPTREIAKHMLLDALRLMDEEARRDGVLSFYDSGDVETAFSLWKDVPYHTPHSLPQGFSFVFKDAGHILGSAMIELCRGGKTIVFTGDLGNTPTPLLRDTEKLAKTDYLVMESVYGDRNHEGREDRRERLLEAVQRAIKRKGTLLIPSFSLEKAQVLLSELNYFVENGAISPLPVYLDSPLAVEVTKIYRANRDLLNGFARELMVKDDIFSFPKLRVTSTGFESRNIASVPDPKIIIAGSGMSTGGRIVSHERHYLPDPKNTILFVGYQAAGSLGREIQDGAKTVIIENQKVPVRAQVETITGYSSHKDMDRLIEFVEPVAASLRKVFVVMGETRSALFLVQRLRDFLGVDAIHPEEGSEWEIDV